MARFCHHLVEMVQDSISLTVRSEFFVSAKLHGSNLNAFSDAKSL
jgi:hypothetical protein